MKTRLELRPLGPQFLLSNDKGYSLFYAALFFNTQQGWRLAKGS